MNLKALHHYLTTLSPSEEKYRNGYVYDGWKDMPRKQCNGVEYTILDLDVAYSPLDNKPADHSPGLNAELSEISIKKNSRFSTVQFQNISIPTLRLTMSIPEAARRLLTDTRSLCKRTRFS